MRIKQRRDLLLKIKKECEKQDAIVTVPYLVPKAAVRKEYEKIANLKIAVVPHPAAALTDTLGDDINSKEVSHDVSDTYLSSRR